MIMIQSPIESAEHRHCCIPADTWWTLLIMKSWMVPRMSCTVFWTNLNWQASQ